MQSISAPASAPARISLLGAKLRSLRVERGWSMGRLSSVSGVDKSVISRLEAGLTRNVHEDNVQKLAAAFGIPVEELEGVGSRPATPNRLMIAPASEDLVLGDLQQDIDDFEMVERSLEALNIFSKQFADAIAVVVDTKAGCVVANEGSDVSAKPYYGAYNATLNLREAVRVIESKYTQISERLRKINDQISKQARETQNIIQCAPPKKEEEELFRRVKAASRDLDKLVKSVLTVPAASSETKSSHPAA